MKQHKIVNIWIFLRSQDKAKYQNNGFSVFFFSQLLRNRYKEHRTVHHWKTNVKQNYTRVSYKTNVRKCDESWRWKGLSCLTQHVFAILVIVYIIIQFPHPSTIKNCASKKKMKNSYLLISVHTYIIHAPLRTLGSNCVS